MRNEQVLCSRAVHCCGQDPAAECQLAATEMDKRWRYCRNKKCSTTIRDTSSSSGAHTLTTRAAPWASTGPRLEVSSGHRAPCIPFPVPGASEERGLAMALTSADTLSSRDLSEVGWVGIMYVIDVLMVHFVYSAAEFGWIFNLHQSLDREWDLRAESIECRIYNQMGFCFRTPTSCRASCASSRRSTSRAWRWSRWPCAAGWRSSTTKNRTKIKYLLYIWTFLNTLCFV